MAIKNKVLEENIENRIALIKDSIRWYEEDLSSMMDEVKRLLSAISENGIRRGMLLEELDVFAKQLRKMEQSK